MPFSKIKYSLKDGVALEWRDAELAQAVEHRLTSSQEPRPEFLTALQAFAQYVRHLCDLPMSFEAGLVVSGVSISENDTQGRGIVVTALKKVSGANSPLVLNTPHVPETATSEGQPELPAFAVRMLNTLEEEAALYRAGQRAQVDMFAGKAVGADAPAPAAPSTTRPRLVT